MMYSKNSIHNSLFVQCLALPHCANVVDCISDTSARWPHYNKVFYLFKKFAVYERRMCEACATTRTCIAVDFIKRLLHWNF
jgi:hypothetical protein